MNKITKMANKDAVTFLAAEMAYGEGAGTRRKLVKAMVDQKMVDYAGTDYAELFEEAYHRLDLNKFAQQAIRERKAMDRAAMASKNLRALKNGNMRGLSTGVFLVVGGVYLARATGYDKVIVAESKKVYKKAKVEFRYHKLRLQGKNVERLL